MVGSFFVTGGAVKPLRARPNARPDTETVAAMQFQPLLLIESPLY